MGTPNIQISKALLDKLAGKLQQQSHEPNSRQQRNLPQLAGLPLLPREVAASLAADAQLRKALQSSRRVGQLLLKNEEEEVQQVQQLAQELERSSFIVKLQPKPCQQEEQDCISCYHTNPQDPLKCASFVQAYSRCATSAAAATATTAQRQAGLQ